MTVTPPTSWVRDFRPMVRTVANVSADAGVLRNYAEAVGLGADVPPLPEVLDRVVRAEGWSAPRDWEMRDGAWWTFTLGGMRPVCDAEPVCHVSH